MSELARFHFLRPEWLWLLLPLGVALVVHLFVTGTSSPWRPFVKAELLRVLEARQPRLRRFDPEIAAGVLGALCVLCAAGPSSRPQAQSGDPAKSPLIVVFELGQSMAKSDVSPSRAERARLEVLDLLRTRPDSPTALVVVAGTAHVLMPFTSDVAGLEPYVRALSPDLMPNDGQAFEQAARRVSELSERSAVPPSVLLVSDGMPASGAHAFEQLRQRKGLGLVTFSVGSERDAERRALDSVASETIELGLPARDVGRLVTALAASRAGGAPARDERFWQDDAPVFSWLLVLGVALWFRRGFVLGRARWGHAAVVTLTLLCLACSSPLAGIWLTPDQRGRLAFDRGDYLGAAAAFEDPMWKATSYYAAEKWDQTAAVLVGRDDADSLFLLGNAYAEGGKLQSALHAYERALQRRPTFRAARRNYDRIQELLHSLQEDTDAESTKKIDEGNDDDATRVDPDTLADKPHPESVATPVSAKSAAGAVEEHVWLARLSTDPSEFLKRKLAMQATRGETR